MAQSDNTDSHLILSQTNKGIIFRRKAFDTNGYYQLKIYKILKKMPLP